MRCTSYAPKGRTYRAARSVVHNIGPPTRLGDAVKETNCSRREFLGMSAAAAGASLAAHSMVPLPRNLIPAAVAASDRVRFGMVGVGMQGNWLLSESIKLPGVECAAACDLYDGRHTLAREIVRADLPVTRRYQTLLEDKNIDCIVAAVPDHWHKQVVVDAVSAGKDIYCEKPMSHTPADGVAMVDAAKKTGRIVQIGSQRVSSQICAKARELIAQGTLGDLMLVEGWLGRNDPTGAWQYPPPPDLSPRNLDWDTWQGTVPKRAFDPNIFARWRCWKEYGTGVAGDLLVHLISGTYPRAMRKEYLEKWHQENDPKPGQAAAMPETMSFSGPDFADVRPHLWTFFEAVRPRKPVIEDAVFGHNAALACHMANESYFRKSAVSWDEASKTIR